LTISASAKPAVNVTLRRRKKWIITVLLLIPPLLRSRPLHARKSSLDSSARRSSSTNEDRKGDRDGEASWWTHPEEAQAKAQAQEVTRRVHRRVARRDDNEQEIVEGLRKGGASVYMLDDPLDLLVGYEGMTTLIEVKGVKGSGGGTSHRLLTDAQKEFIATWKGGRILIVRTLEEALLGIGIPYQTEKEHL